MMIEAFAQGTLTLIFARITNIRRVIETQANFLFKIRAQRVAEFAVGTFSIAIRLVFAKMAFDAILPKNAAVAATSVSVFETVIGAGANLA